MRRSGVKVVGILRISRGGTAFVVPDGGGPEILLSGAVGSGALAGDRIEAVLREAKWGLRGRVVDVLEPRTRGALGVVERSGKGFRVALDRHDLPPWLNVGRSALAGAEVGERVWVELLREGSGAATPNCAVREVLGRGDDPGTDFRAVALNFGFPEAFPRDAVLESERIEAGRCERGGRRDFRDELVFTVDPADAKDHDDALSYKELSGGFVEVGVHIADVSRFVANGGAIDRAARERGTSVYLCDGVLPMLPPRLSGNLCSLLPDRDRLTLSVLFTMTQRAEVKKLEMAPCVISSKAALSYEGAEACLDPGRDHGPLGVALRALAQLADRLAERRGGKGALSLEIPEPKVSLDDRGAPTAVEREARLGSHRIIEEFMLLANEATAAAAARKRLPFIYRVHPPPKLEKLEELSLKLGELGVRFSAGSVRKGRDLETPLRALSGDRRRALGAYLVLRAMERARYAPAPSLHFGLASDCYCHFTSPIRRYPDLFNHRALVRAVFRRAESNGAAHACSGEREDPAALDSETISERSTAAEERAQAAERESVRIKCIRFMEGKLGECYCGMVTAVVGPGYAVELDDYLIEGFARGPATAKRRARGGGLFLGDRVVVRVARADPLRREFELAIVKKGEMDSDNRRCGSSSQRRGNDAG